MTRRERLWGVVEVLEFLCLLLLPGLGRLLHLSSPLQTHLTSASLNIKNWASSESARLGQLTRMLATGTRYFSPGLSGRRETRWLSPGWGHLERNAKWSDSWLSIWLTLDASQGCRQVTASPELCLAPAALTVRVRNGGVPSDGTVHRLTALHVIFTCHD